MGDTLFESIPCWFRVTPLSGIIRSTYNIYTNKVALMPENWINISLKAYEYNLANYQYYSVPQISSYYSLFTKYSDALLIIDYNNIGAIVISRTYHLLHLFATNLAISDSMIKQDDVLYTDNRCIGIAKTILDTLLVIQRNAFLYETIVDGIRGIYTTKGFIPYNISCDTQDIDKMNYSMFLTMLHIKDSYGIVSVNDEPKILMLINKTFSIL